MANILNQIRKSIAGIIGGFRTATTRFWSFGNKEVYPEVEQGNAISYGFNANGAVYSIVKKYAKKASSIERYLENKADDTEIEDHDLIKLLERPNENQSGAAFFKVVYCYFKVCGEAFIWLNRGDVSQAIDENGNIVERTNKEYLSQPVVEMFVIPPNEITIIVDTSDPNLIIEYLLTNNNTVKFRKEDIVHWKDVNLSWDELARPQLRGMTPLKPGSKTLAADNSLIESMLRMAQNDGARAIAYNKSLNQPTPQQQTQIESVFGDKINNKDRKNQVQALQGDWGLLQLGLTSVDMDTLNAREFIYKELCFILDVPYGFFDSHTPYAEKQLAARDWISNSIKPDVKELDQELQRMLFPAFKLTDKMAKLCSDFDSLPELQEDKAKQIEWLMKSPLTPNEVREAMEYEPIKDPIMDEVFMPTGSSSIMAEPDVIPNDQNAYP
jgi:HK97 family phage portal protein